MRIRIQIQEDFLNADPCGSGSATLITYWLCIIASPVQQFYNLELAGAGLDLELAGAGGGVHTEAIQIFLKFVCILSVQRVGVAVLTGMTSGPTSHF